MVFTTLAFSQMAHVMAIRSGTDSLFRIGVLSNRWLATAVGATVGLQLAVIYVPLLNRVFDTLPLGFGDVGLAVSLAGIVLAAVEVEKWLRRGTPRGLRGARASLTGDSHLGRWLAQ